MKTALVLLATLTASGCATLFAEHRVSVPVTSQVPGAEIIIDGMPAGRTPMTLNLNAHTPHTIMLRGVGGEAGCALEPRIGVGWVVLDLFGGVIPLVVDLATGNWQSVDALGCYGPV